SLMPHGNSTQNRLPIQVPPIDVRLTRRPAQRYDEAMPASDRPLGFADLAGCHALITGASSGIGRAVALEFVRAGANLIVHHRRSGADADNLADQINAMQRTANVMPLDLHDHDDYSEFVEAAWLRLNGIHIWVNNAGADLLTGGDAQLPYEEKLQR